jgi:outer membrane protein assembly factor BamB
LICFRKALIVVCANTLVVAALAVAAWGEDWPQWRGKNRDAVLSETGLIETLPEGVLPRRWTATVGAGYSGPTVADGRVFVTDRGSDEAESEVERVLCFDADTGKPIWNHTYPSKYLIQYRAGPRASVTVHQGKALSVGAMGQFKCLDAASGEVLWQRDLAKEYKARMPTWGITASPLVYDDLVIQIAAGSQDACVVAMDLQTGKERWHALDERAGYAAPILVRQGDQDVVVCWTGESVSGLDPRSGKTLWRVPMASRNMPIGVATPVVQDDHLFVSSFYDGSMLIRIDPSRPEAEKVWWRVGINEKNTDALHCMISTPILKGQYIYGVDSYGELRCLDIKTGDRVWVNQTAVERDRWATIHIIQSGDREIMLNEQGELIYATLTPEGYDEHSRCSLIAPTRKQLRRRAGAGVTWAHPAIADGYIFARSDSELICASLKGKD